MPGYSSSYLPDESSWRFDAIACSEPDRASALKEAGPPGALIEALVSALEQAFGIGDVRLGREPAGSQWDDCRAVLQFEVGARVFDWFFNARTGYRAHFRVRYECGLKFNNQIVEALRLRLDASLPLCVHGRELNSEFED